MSSERIRQIREYLGQGAAAPPSCYAPDCVYDACRMMDPWVLRMIRAESPPLRVDVHERAEPLFLALGGPDPLADLCGALVDLVRHLSGFRVSVVCSGTASCVFTCPLPDGSAPSYGAARVDPAVARRTEELDRVMSSIERVTRQGADLTTPGLPDLCAVLEESERALTEAEVSSMAMGGDGDFLDVNEGLDGMSLEGWEGRPPSETIQQWINELMDDPTYPAREAQVEFLLALMAHPGVMPE